MDVNATLARLRELVKEIDAAADNEHKADIADEFADLIDGLDQWITRGGFLPSAWQRGQK